MAPTKQASEEKIYIKYIAYLQIIGIILVVFGHSFHEYPDGYNGFSLPIYKMMVNFRMPLFLFVSGFLMVYTTFMNQKKPLISSSKFTINKVKRLLIPFFTLLLVTFFPRSQFSFMADDEVTFTAETFIKSLIFDDKLVIPFFWFLQASFLLLIFCFAYIYLARKHNIKAWQYNIILFIIFAILPFMGLKDVHLLSIGKICNLGLFFVLGCIYAHYDTYINKCIPWHKLSTFIICGLLWVAFFFLSEYQYIFYLTASLFGIGMCLSLAQWLVDNNYTFLDHLTGSNYIIFLLSWYFNILTQQVLHHFISLPWQVHTFLSLVSGIYVPYLAFKLMQKHADKRIVKVCAFCLGQNLKKRPNK